MIKLKEIAIKIFERAMSIEDVYDLSDELTDKILFNFLYKNNEDMTKHVDWRLIKLSRIKKIWEDFVKTNNIRDERGFYEIEDIMIQNTLKIYIFTKLTGHTESDPSEIFESNFDPYIKKYIKSFKSNIIDPNQYQLNFSKTGKALKPSLPKPVEKFDNKYFDSIIKDNMLEDLRYDELFSKLYDALLERFSDYYCEDPDSGQAYISDYGLKPLMDYLYKLISTNDLIQKLYIIDKMLNVVHQRSDLASWFVEGGISSLEILSGNDEE